MAQEIKVADVLSAYGAFVTYVPLKTEVPFLDYLSLPKEAPTHTVTPRASLNPEEEAKAVRVAFKDSPVAVFVPGRAFDALGTRHGRGGGWYDRFLGYLPKNWLRVGFCYPSQFSEAPLLRQPWDQPVDYVCVAEGEQLFTHETHARDILKS
ncbi:MAG: 5-formyltetrahydrofolate cyclo-ligase [Patescibacteria group bacterium]